ncbi:MAG: flavin reductase family protein [Acidobacteria bacterium]|nr:flavin reductase family protein [Acidobacteriota bacterium]
MSSKPLQRSLNFDKREFCRACGQFATGVAIAAVRDVQGAPHGITVNSFTSVSLAPPLILICIAHTAGVLAHFRACEHFAVNVLNEAQQALSEHFARRGEDRFEGVEWEPGATGAPLVGGVLAAIECQRIRTEMAGDHDILIAEVVGARIHSGRPLVYFGSAYRHLAPR